MSVAIDRSLEAGTELRESFDAEGRLSARMHFLDGRPHGEAISYRPDGTVQTRLHFKQGRQHGEVTVYAADGRPAQRAQFLDGRLDGPAELFRDGGREALIRFKDGLRHGEAVFFHPNGRKRTVQVYERGLLAGEEQHYDEAERLLAKMTYAAGRRQGRAVTYYPGTDRVGALRLGRDIHRAKLTVKETTDGRRFWDERLEILPALGDGGGVKPGAGDSKLLPPTPTPAATIDVADLLSGVKSDTGQLLIGPAADGLSSSTGKPFSKADDVRSWLDALRSRDITPPPQVDPEKAARLGYYPAGRHVVTFDNLDTAARDRFFGGMAHADIVQAVADLVESMPDQGFKIELSTLDDAGGVDIGLTAADGSEIQLEVRPDGDRTSVYHRWFHLAPDRQRQGHGRTIMRAMLDLYARAGVDRIDIVAGHEAGGYAWARAGFTPSPQSWSRLRETIDDDITDFVRHEGLSETDAERLRVFAERRDPKTIWEIADFAGSDGRRWGKNFLAGAEWHGTLELTDPTVMDRANSYAGRTPQAIGKRHISPEPPKRRGPGGPGRGPGNEAPAQRTQETASGKERVPGVGTPDAAGDGENSGSNPDDRAAIRLAVPDLTPTEITRQLSDRLRAVGLDDSLTLSLHPQLFMPGPDGRPVQLDADFHAEAGIVRVALDAADPLAALDHEIVHVLRRMGVLDERAWSILSRAAQGNRRIWDSVQQDYGDKGLTETQLREEGVARLAEDRSRRRMNTPPMVTACSTASVCGSSSPAWSRSAPSSRRAGRSRRPATTKPAGRSRPRRARDMPNETVATATLTCSFGSAPGVLSVTTGVTVLTAGMPSGTTMDYAPLGNIPSFGMCSSAANPTVAAATASAMGVLTPMPCVPSCAAPWVPGSPTVTICGLPALSNSSKATCLWGGMIGVTMTPALTVEVP